MKLLKNTLWNMLGLVIPSIVAIPAMAVMARVLGVEKFGLFMLAFSVIGYAGIFDGGLTRAVIRSVAMNDDKFHNKKVIGTASGAVFLLGLTATLLFYFGANQLVNLLKVSEIARADTVKAFKILAFIIPPYLLSLVWFAYPEGKQEFVQLNILKTISASMVALLPAAAILVEPTLVYALIGLLIARVIAFAIAYGASNKKLGSNVFVFDLKTLKDLVNFSVWITVSNIVSPLMVYADRFLLANFMGAGNVAFYTAPSEVIARLSVIPGAVSRTIFPFFSKMQGSATSTAQSASKGLFIVCVLVALPVFSFSHEILNVWLGEPYGAESSSILRILLVGYIFNAVSQIPFSLLQANGFSKLTALIHMGECLPYLALLVILVPRYGIAGAALAWVARVTLDFFLLNFFCSKQIV